MTRQSSELTSSEAWKGEAFLPLYIVQCDELLNQMRITNATHMSAYYIALYEHIVLQYISRQVLYHIC